MWNTYSGNCGTPEGGGGVSGGIPGSSSNLILGESQRTCKYKDFMNWKPRHFYENEGVVGLNRWMEKIKFALRNTYLILIIYLLTKPKKYNVSA